MSTQGKLTVPMTVNNPLGQIKEFQECLFNLTMKTIPDWVRDDIYVYILHISFVCLKILF